MPYNPDIHHRRSIRLKGYDYSRAGLYFLTLCCANRDHLFGHIEKGTMCLNLFGSIAWQEWLNTSTIRPNITLDAFIVMPNHIHGIIEIKEQGPIRYENRPGQFKGPSQTIGAIIRGYKGATTKRIKGIIRDSEGDFGRAGTGELQFAPTGLIDLNKSIWQRDYYDIIIRDAKAYHNISNYIINNPIKWEKDKFYKK